MTIGDYNMSSKLEQMVEDITDIDPIIKKTSKGAKVLYFLAIAVFIATVSTFILVWNIRDTSVSEVYSPLAEYPVQDVITNRRIDGIDAVSLWEPVEVSGTKCIDPGQNIEITAIVSWQPISPRGNAIEVGTGIRRPEAGCTTERFENVIPLEVRLALIEQFNSGIVNPTWSIIGRETPVNIDTGEIGTSKIWYTENFIVINDPATIPAGWGG